MQQSIPEAIRDHSDCLLFESYPINRLLLERDDVRVAYASLCAFPDERDKLQVIHRALMGAWCSHRGRSMNLLELVELAKQGMKPEYFVSLTRKPGPELSRALTEVLDRFGTMNYQVQEGFLRYVIADGLLSGQCPFRVGTEQFDAWSTAIIDASPHDMLELIGLLMRQRS